MNKPQTLHTKGKIQPYWYTLYRCMNYKLSCEIYL